MNSTNATDLQMPLIPARSTLLRVFIPFAAGYFFSYLYRVVNAVIAPNLVADLGLSPADLGLLTATYFLAFAAFQLPLGVLLDRFGSRKTEAILLLFAALGAFIFAKAGSVPGLIVGRALIGFGVSSCLMAAFTAFVIWYPKERLPLINGIQVAVGGMGALTGTAPVEAALHVSDWRTLFLILAFLTLGVAVGIFFVVPERKAQGKSPTLGEQIRGMGQVYASPLFWRIAPWAVTSQAAFMAIQTLWAGPWLRDVAGYDRTAMAEMLLVIAAAMVVGFALIGALASRLSKSAIQPLHLSVVGMGTFMAIQALILLHIPSLAVPLWILFGFFGASGILNFAILSQRFPQHLAGRVNTALNLMVFVLAFFGQWAIGEIINLWPVLPDGRYAPQSYQAGFGVMLGLQVLGVIWFVAMGVRLRHKARRS